VALPAFLYPKKSGVWVESLKKVQVNDLAEKPAADREYSLLGGGDIGFPLMLASSVYFAIDLRAAVLVAAFSLVGLMGAFLIQWLWLKGKPMPALPPIAICSLIGFVIARYGMG
jgi:presenilin-like A22 family membrane protease